MPDTVLKTMIEARELSKNFGRVRALRALTFRVDPGQVVGLLGRNGAGKSTAMRILTGYLHQDAGRASICGIDTIERPALARATIGYLPESGSPHPEMPVRDYLRYRTRLHSLTARRARRAIDDAMDRCGLTDAAGRRIGRLSKGYRQRVALAAAIVHDPPVLVLDEPSSGLDPAQARQMRALVRDLGSSRAVIVSSHVLPEVEATCDRVLIIADGRLRADAPLADLSSSAAPCLVELPVHDGSDLDARLRLLRAIDGVTQAEALDAPPPPPGWGRFRIRAEGRAPDLAEAVGAAAHAAGLPVRELRAERPTLEDLFMRCTEAEA